MAQSCPTCGAALSPESSPADLCAQCLLGAVLFADPAEPADVDGPALRAPGSRLGDFRIVRLLGRGGMATVYEAEDTRLQRVVALKTLPPEFLHDRAFARRFEQEARLVASLDHPRIVPIYATGIDDGVPWMSMPVLRGGSVATLIERRVLTPAAAIPLLRDAALALDYAHACGVVHRDIKPANLLLDHAGRVAVSDFGLARVVLSDAQVTRTGVFAGTPQYMAPEQALGRALDHRCDIYSLGIVAYELFTGTTPFAADSPVGVLLQHVSEQLPAPPGRLLAPATLRAIVKATAKDPSDRWPTATAFVDAIDARDSLPTALAHLVSAKWSWRVAAGVLLLTGCLGGAMTLRRSSPNASQPLLPPRPDAARAAALVIPEPRDPPRVEGLVEPRSAAQLPKPRRGASPAESPTTGEPATAEIVLPSAAPLGVTPTEDRGPTTAAAMTPADAQSPSVPAAAPPTVGTDEITRPVRIRTATPEYPSVARAAQIEGDVVLEAVVGIDGRVSAVAVIKPVHPLLDESARAAVSGYRYTPGLRNGIPESAIVRITVSFKMR